MHVAVQKGAPENSSFKQCVDSLHDKNWLTPDGKRWVDYIRTKSNEANHEIVLASKEGAEALLYLTEAMLILVYELPASVPGPPSE